MSNKGYEGKTQHFAAGGEVLGRTKDFMKTPDRFRDSQFKKQEPTQDNFGKDGGGDAGCAPPAHGKSLKAVVPRC